MSVCQFVSLSVCQSDHQPEWADSMCQYVSVFIARYVSMSVCQHFRISVVGKCQRDQKISFPGSWIPQVDVFLKASFSLLGRLLCAQGAQKAPKTEAKWSPKGARRHPLGSVKTMAGAIREAYGEVWGRVRRLFPDCVSRPSLDASWGIFLQILGYFGSPLGALGAHFGSLRGPEMEEMCS